MGALLPAGCYRRQGYDPAMMNAHSSTGWVSRWLAAGFRPFFLLAGLHALIAVPLWVHFFTQGGVLHGMPLMYWHAHEMLHGFVAAAIAGFLLTAVPNWTSTLPASGWRLGVLVALWLGGRAAMFIDGLDVMWLAVIQLAFLPALLALLLPPLLRTANRNVRLAVVIAVLWLAEAGFLYAVLAQRPDWAATALLLAMNLVLILITVIGGRIIPAFTGNALRKAGVEVKLSSPPWLEYTVLVSMLAITVVDLLWHASVVSGVLAAVAALAHAFRLWHWQGWRARRDSLVWVLHAGYPWVVLGLALKACWLLLQAGWAMKWQHAIAGAFAMMILAVMTRAALGHSGRPLQASRLTTVSYVLLTLALLLRTFAVQWPTGYMHALALATVLWTAAFLCYLIVYVPVLLGPRADGRPG